MEFTVETRYTLEEYRRYNRDVSAAMQNGRQKVIALAVLFLTALGIILWTRVYWLLGLLALVALAVPILMLKSAREVKTAWEQNPAIKDVVYRYQFGPAEVEVTGGEEHHRVRYSKLYRLVENKTNLYLMLSQNSGFILSKSACTPEQLAFIRQKCGGAATKH